MQDKPRVAIIGVTGFIGRGLPDLLAAEGFACTGVSRSGGGSVAGIDLWQTPAQLDLAGHYAVINLAGEPIERRWTTDNRRSFHESRVGVTRQVVEAIRVLPAEARPRVLVNTSAVGIYGDRGDEILTESASAGDGYLAELCQEWEAAAIEAGALGVRVVRPRFGVVLGQDGAAFQKLLLVFKSGLGGRLGSGRQWMAWIHLDDLHAALVHALVSDTLMGAANFTAPSPERNVNFTRKFAAALHRPAVLPVPAFALKLALDGFGGVLLAGQRALPAALEADGFRFRHATLESAFAELLS
ncbi:MAG: TIGR01777 family oxidoreductase [Luteolibacter sp.]|nr:TIGR01777 family oxidoreductase [Luteolibacter sp.]